LNKTASKTKPSRPRRPPAGKIIEEMQKPYRFLGFLKTLATKKTINTMYN